jgi:hypothetical protein
VRVEHASENVEILRVVSDLRFSLEGWLAVLLRIENAEARYCGRRLQIGSSSRPSITGGRSAGAAAALVTETLAE